MSNGGRTTGAFRGLASAGFHRVVFHQWGAQDNPDVVVCVHGLTRNGRDFDELGARLAARYRVVCPDMPGRGESEWLANPADYSFATYVATLTALIAHTRAETVRWVGTSMGGLLGIVLAAQASTPLRALVVNDVGPVLAPAALARIAGYVGLDPRFPDFAALEAHVRLVSAPFGRLSDAQWRHLALTTARELPDGTFALRYDPGIAVPFRAAASEAMDLWGLWDRIACPTLLLRGARSDLLTADTAREMTSRGPRPQLIEFDEVGHAPMLLTDEQLMPVIDFLDVSGHPRLG